MILNGTIFHKTQSFVDEMTNDHNMPIPGATLKRTELSFLSMHLTVDGALAVLYLVAPVVFAELHLDCDT